MKKIVLCFPVVASQVQQIQQVTEEYEVIDAGQEEKYNDAIESDGSIYAVGRRRIPSIGGAFNQGLVGRYDLSGNQIWRKNGLDSVLWFDVAAQAGGGFVAVGQATLPDEEAMAWMSADGSDWSRATTTVKYFTGLSRSIGAAVALMLLTLPVSGRSG